MKRNIKKTTAFILSVIMILTVLPGGIFSAFAINTECERLFKEAADERAESVVFPVQVNPTEFINQFIERNPEYFFVNLTACGFWTNGKVDMAYHDYSASQIKAFNDKIDSIIGMTDGMSDTVDKIIFIHEYIMENCEYDYTYKNRSAYNCLMDGVCVCEGYSDALICILHKMGIECGTVVSDINNHEWDVIKINGKWYYIDITHDDTLGKVHINLLISGEKCAAQDHKTVTYQSGAKGDWLFNSEDNCTVLYNNKEFDNAFWQSAVNIMSYKNGVWYYTDGLDVYSCNYPSAPVKLTSHNENDYKWHSAEGSQYYVGHFSDVVLNGGKLYYSTENTIRSINTDGSDDTLVYTLSKEEQAKGRIYDLKSDGDKLYFYLAKSPVDSFCHCAYLNLKYDHSHIMSDWAVKKKASCTANGVEERHCTVKGCDYSETRNIEKLSHSYGDWSVVNKATCTENGLEKRTCKSCGSSEERVIDSLGHNYGKFTELKSADCVNAGLSVRKCTRCDSTETVPIPAKGHSFGEWSVTKQPSCTENGEKTRKCVNCTATETDTVNAKGHSFGKWTITAKATCYEDGAKERTCSECGKHETSKINKLEHRYSEWKTITPATCTKEGLKSKVCEYCGNEVKSIILPEEHSFGEWQTVKAADCINTGLEKRICKNCKIEETRELPLAEHNVEEWFNAENSGGIFGGIINVEYLKGYPVATCYQEGREHGKCTVCGKEIDRTVPKLEHNFEVDILEEPTCTTPGRGYRHCTNPFCFYSKKEIIILEAKGHTCEDTKITVKPTCTEDGEETGICSVCKKEFTNKIEAIGHDFSDWKMTETATCLKQGVKKRVCKNCGEVQTEYTEKTDHSYGDAIIVTEPTCTKDGNAVRVCNICNKTEDKTLSATGHKFSDWELSEDGSSQRHCLNCDYAETKEPGYKIGDANGDGKVNTSDARKILRVTAKLETFTETEKKAADVNKDGKINTQDARLILRFVAKLISVLEQIAQ